MTTIRRNRRTISLFLSVLMFTWQIGQPLIGATLYWDADASSAGNLIDGTNLGGTGNWDTSTANWWDTSGMVAWPNAGADMAIFSGPVTAGVPTSR